MSEEKFEFHGQTTYINRPSNTVIHDFQNNYMRGDGSTVDQINSELKRLIGLSLAAVSFRRTIKRKWSRRFIAWPGRSVTAKRTVSPLRGRWKQSNLLSEKLRMWRDRP